MTTQPAEEELRHGKYGLSGVSSYVNRGCRCGECKTAWADYIRTRRHLKKKAKEQEANE